jgi:hypothetical protein
MPYTICFLSNKSMILCTSQDHVHRPEGSPPMDSHQGVTELTGHLKLATLPKCKHSSKQHHNSANMSIKTRSKYHPSTPKRSQKRHEASSNRKLRFFDALDRSGGRKSFRTLATEYAPSRGTACRWKQERDEMGTPAYHRTRKYSENLGRKPTFTAEKAKMLVDPKNPVRDQTYEAQAEYHHLMVGPRTIQRGLKKYTNKGGRYKRAYVKKELSEKNKRIRTKYGIEHKEKTIEEFWSRIFYTDEAHIDPTQMRAGEITREQGHRYDPENILQRPQLKGVTLHIAGWVTWDEKCDKLEFYHDEEQHIKRPKRPPKPRKRMYESQEVLEERLREWEALLPHDIEVKPLGNSMKQQYYVDRLLPVYSDALEYLSTKYDKPYLF